MLILGIAACVALFSIFGLITYLVFDAIDSFLNGLGLEYLFFFGIFIAIDLALVWAFFQVWHNLINPYFLGR